MAPQVIDFSSWNEMWKQSYYDREKGIRATPLIEYWDKRAHDFSLMVKVMLMILVVRCTLR